MRRVKRRTFSGVVCEQEIYTISERATPKTASPRLRFKTDEDRARHKSGISRRNHARLFNENFSPRSLYSTLTLDDKHEVHDFKDAKRIRDNYVRRLQRACPDAVIFAYLGRGKNTQRIHMHMVSIGVPESLIFSKWGQGDIKRIVNLREHCFYDGVDHGQDYTGLANYLFDHWTPEQGGHRWKMTKNARRPQREDPREVKRIYTETRPPSAPKGYVLVETRATDYGYLYYKYVKIPPPRKRKRKEDGT